MPDPDDAKPRRRKPKSGRPPLFAREVRFCRQFVEKGNAYQCYLDAGFPPKATRQATDQAVKRLVRKRQIIAYCRELQHAAMDAAMVSIEEVAQALRRIALADRGKLFDDFGRLLPPSEWPPDVAACVEGVDSEEVYEKDPARPGRRVLSGYMRKVRTARRTEALKVLAAWLKMTGTDSPDPSKTGPAPLVVGGEADPNSL
jgi:phage terminase small subunit